ncbi:MAG: riboflavin synthase [Dehalococcoidia bacterium]
MFTGIVEELGTVAEVRPGGLAVRAGKVLEDAKLGDSICVNGVCLTVTSLDGTRFSVDTVPETLRRSNLGDMRPGDAVNLERALRPSDRMGGHFVQGHIEGTGRVESVSQDGPALMLRIQAPPALMRFIVEKGFIAIDGTSLTVVERDDASFSVTLIPVTREWTTLGRRQRGDRVNLETDILAKYVEQLLAGRQTAATATDGG